MKILYRMTKVNMECKVETQSKECTLVDILRKDTRPDPSLIYKYYGDEAPNGAFGAVPNTRLVLQDEEGKYIIMPDVPNNLYWSIIKEN